jgi:hypothetical protein
VPGDVDPSQVHRTFALNGLGSQQLGRGPYQGNALDLTVAHRQITRVAQDFPATENGFEHEKWTPIRNWVETTHPDDAELMHTQGEATLSEAELQRYLRLWEQRTADYVETQSGVPTPEDTG